MKTEIQLVEILGHSRAHVPSNWDELETLGGIWTLVAEHGRIDVLVNNAGHAVMDTIKDVPTSAIANIGSSITFAPILALCTDAATKSAVEGYTEVLQAEVAAFGIGVLLVKPGATATEFASEIGSGIKVESSEPYQEGILKYVSNMTNLSRSAPNVAISVAVVERVELWLRHPLGQNIGSDLEKKAVVFAGPVNLKDAWGSS
ncbi:putative short chain oxidoreductase/dehydrogenase [Nemania serpens]|nr:putative short chain oxidoreductase/dehydrogenase [Nemania serpens]